MKYTTSLLVCALLLSSCQQNEKPGVAEPATDGRRTWADDLRRAIQEGCKYVPTLNTVLQIADVVTPNIDKVGKIAAEVCKVIEGGSKGAEPPVYRGVQIRGRYEA